MREGKIVELNETNKWGLIQPDGPGEKLRFRFDDVLNLCLWAEMLVGTRVRFDERNTRGDKIARNILPVVQVSESSLTGCRFYNPYNFVRFLTPRAKHDMTVKEDKKATRAVRARPRNNILADAFRAAQEASESRQATSQSRAGHELEDRLLGRCPPPPHDRYVGISGRIVCEAEAVTPLFVSDSENVTGESHKSYRFYQRHGERALPASSLRGMIRSIFEAATNACMIQMAGNRRLTRHVTDKEAQALVPARVIRQDNELWLEILNGDTPFVPGRPPGNGHAQYAAWVPQYLTRMLVHRHRTNHNGPYGARQDVALPLETHDIEGRPKPVYALLQEIDHPSGKFRFYSASVIKQSKDQFPATQPGQIVRKGYLHLTNQNIENKHDERLFFSRKENPQRIGPLPADVIEGYRQLINDYKERHRDHVKKAEREGRDPEEPDTTHGKAAFSRHIVREGSESLQDGDLVYALVENASEVSFLGPVARPRIPYKCRIQDCLPSSGAAEAPDDATGLGDITPCSDVERLCPACRTFGWVAHQEPGRQTEHSAYAGRLRLSDAKLIEDRGRLDATSLAVLSAPKPTTVRFYLEEWRNGARVPRQDGRWGKSADKGYDGEDHRLRGRKVYRHHRAASEQEYRHSGGNQEGGSDQNRTVRDALMPGARFRFSIDFENLAPLELGALLWTLELDGKAYHRLGYAKPLGFGSVKVHVKGLRRMNPGQRYQGTGSRGGWESIIGEKEGLIDAFKQALIDAYPDDGKDGFESLPNIADLLTLLSEPAEDLPIHYPRSTEEPDPEGKNFTWFVTNNRRAHLVLPLPQEDHGLPLLRPMGGR